MPEKYVLAIEKMNKLIIQSFMNLFHSQKVISKLLVHSPFQTLLTKIENISRMRAFLGE